MSESRFQSRAYNSVADDQQSGGLAAQIAKWAGGIISLSLVIGVVYWAFQLGQRDANDVPVIQAMGGVARERPVDPEGKQADYQGLDVNAVLASDETAPVGAETRLAPPPQRANPEDQPVSDQPVGDPAEVPVVILPVVPVEEPAQSVETLTVIPTETPAETPAETPVETPAQTTALVGDPNMTRPKRRVEQPGLSPSSELLSNAIAAAIEQEANTSTQTAPLASTGNEASSEIPIGTQMIQLGVFDDEQSALRNWDFLLANQPDLLSGLERYVERRAAGGRVFYRLRAIGFDDAAAASGLCAVLMGRDVQCIPVAAR